MKDDDMTPEARAAYAAAVKEIERITRAGENSLSIIPHMHHQLDRIPRNIMEIEGIRLISLESTQVADISPLKNLLTLRYLNLTNTQVGDIRPLRNLTNLEDLLLDNTQIDDISPLRGLNNLKELILDGTKVYDLRPIRDLPLLEYLHFYGTPAASSTPELTRLSQIEDIKERCTETIAYLKTLPPWPEPLPWAKPPAADALAKATIAKSQIAFILEHAVTSQIEAETTASQIRFALRDIQPEKDSNQLPEVLESMLNIATLFERFSKADIVTGSQTEREAVLMARIAELETALRELNIKLADTELAKQAAEAKARGAGFMANYKAASGKAVGVGQFVLAGTGIPVGALYLLGPAHPVVQALLKLLQ